MKLLKRLAKLADLSDSESVKEAIAKQSWSNGRKSLAVEAYTSFLKAFGGAWKPPTYERPEALPFIPTEAEVDRLIAGCNRRMAAFLQLLKETGARCGEAANLRWMDVDFVSGTVRITPEKKGKAIFKPSNRLMAMLNAFRGFQRRCSEKAI